MEKEMNIINLTDEEAELEEAWYEKRQEKQAEAMQALRESLRDWAKKALTEPKN